MFEGRRKELAGQIKIWMQRIAQLKDEIAGLTAEREAASEQSSLASKETSVIEDMFERGYVTRQRLHSIRRESTQLAGNIGRLDSAIAKARKETGETQLSIEQITLKRQSEILADLKEIEERSYDLKEAHLGAIAELERLTVTAPVSGVVVNSQLNTIGGVIRPGQTVLEIVPGEDPLIVEARVRPLDIDEVVIGQPTEVRFSAFKQRTTPFVMGTVLHVSADAMSDQRTGELYYTADISISNAELGRLSQRLQPGMPAEILIKTGNRTPMAYLAQPLLDSMNKALREK
jgi:HlyD family type I secretion membrane fusion protein